LSLVVAGSGAGLMSPSPYRPAQSVAKVGHAHGQLGVLPYDAGASSGQPSLCSAYQTADLPVMA
jgi:enoyl-CoA hydratase/carnithine racemase